MLTAMLYNVIRSTKTPDDVAGEVMDFILNGLAPPG